ncbi:hypothetical protein HNV12_00205 [Methanococcoides sp. SA1]|nr:hypothetical protein [Methanococcoides sp. SA1]
MRLSEIWVAVITFLGISIIVYVSLSMVFVEENSGPECIEVNRAAGFLYDVCYDTLSNNILMLVEGEMDYDFDSFEVVFFDPQFRRFDLIYEDVNLSQLYKFGANSNPEYINLTLNVKEEFDLPICEEPRKVLIKDCLTNNPGWGKGSLDGTVLERYVSDLRSVRYNISDLVAPEVKEELWKSFCDSNWECGEWEECNDGFQYRDCFDLNGCYVALDVPSIARPCGESCVESWVCEWGECVDGFAAPNCYDENDCGTTYVIPPKIQCSFDLGCVPEIVCGDWSKCVLNYDLFDLAGEGVEELGGSRFRVCSDSNGCVESLKDTRDCSIGVDIYTERFVDCGEQYIGVYDTIDESLIARIGGGTSDDPRLDIYLDSGEGEDVICAHCLNGVLDVDETGVDCGGTCEPCFDDFVAVEIEENFLEKVWRFLN